MSTKTVAWLRKEYTDFFKQKGHAPYPSSSLVPAEDPTLLFTTAGMVQFKDNYMHPDQAADNTVTTIQKCLRTTDLDVVGTTDRHCTFFEMLGNFSFGGYFKKEAIDMAWEFSIKNLALPEEKIWVTIYEEDDEAHELWNKHIGLPAERIVRLGKKDNYWGPAGNSGPCGPCSELYLDRGLEHGCKTAGCQPGCECDRFIEYWNLVFVGFYQDQSGKKEPLASPGIDTGSGLERVVCLLQGVDSVYDTDELARIIGLIGELTGQDYKANKMPFRVIADHIRSVSFAVCDGALPGNEGRGYVIRRLIRRAALYGRKLGLEEAFLYRLLPLVVELYGPFYPELAEKEQFITNLLKTEEERFLDTLAGGLVRFNELVEHSRKEGRRSLAGKDVFVLYDTFGFPLELTRELARENNLEIDEAGFNEEMKKQKEQSQADWQKKQDNLFKNIDDSELQKKVSGLTEFSGYGNLKDTASLLYMAGVDKENAILVFDRTPFYAEGGGQVGDRGTVRNDKAVFRVVDTQKKNDVFFHVAELIHGSIEASLEGMSFELEVDAIHRSRVAGNHSATHLLNAALRDNFGSNLMQTGSYVGSAYLRFDFNLGHALGDEELAAVESWVNEAIHQRKDVATEEMALAAAREAGAVANFGEKYGQHVRVVRMGAGDDSMLSMELCGGTHVANTGDIGSFFITREYSPGAGNRRIEAVSGDGVNDELLRIAEELSAAVKSHNTSLLQRLGAWVPAFNDINTVERSALIETLKKSGHAALEQALLDSFIDTAEVEQPLAVIEKGIRKDYSYRNVREDIAVLQAGLKKAQSSLVKLEKQLQQGQADETFNALKDELPAPGEGSAFVKLFNEEDITTLKSLGDQVKREYPHLVCGFINRRADKIETVVMCHKDLASKGFHSGNVLKEFLGGLGGRGGGKPDMAQGGAPAGSQGDADLTSALKSAVDAALPG